MTVGFQTTFLAFRAFDVIYMGEGAAQPCDYSISYLHVLMTYEAFEWVKHMVGTTGFSVVPSDASVLVCYF